MIESRFLIFLLIILPIWFYFRRRYVLKNNKKIRLESESIVHLFFFYIIAVLYLTLRPFEFQIPFYGNREFYFDTNLFYQLRHMASSHVYYQLLYSVGNILLFVPFGMLGPIVFRRLRHFILLVITGFLFSLLIELTQGLFTLSRAATVDDLFFNTLGAIIGYFIYLILRIVYNLGKSHQKHK